MAQYIAPRQPHELKVDLQKPQNISFETFDKIGDAQLKVAMTNYKLYADNTVKQHMNDLYNQFKNDPIKLQGAIQHATKTIIPDELPQDIKDSMMGSILTSADTYIEKARKNQIEIQERQNKEYTAQGIQFTDDALVIDAENVFNNNITVAENKDPMVNNTFNTHAAQRRAYGQLRDSNGKFVYSERERKRLNSTSDAQYKGFKNFFDNMIVNDDEHLTEATKYYKSQILAPQRFMKESFLDRDAYDKIKKYAEQELKRAGANIKNARFTQSVRDAMALQIENTPEKLQQLRDSGLIKQSTLDKLEKANVTFDNIDPAKPELPTSMIETLDIINSWQDMPAATTDEQKQYVLEQGTVALNNIAEFAEKHGLSQSSVERARNMIVSKEQNQAFADTLAHIGNVRNAFGNSIKDADKLLKDVRNGNSAVAYMDAQTKNDYRKIVDFNNLLAYTTDAANEALRKGDVNAYNNVMNAFHKETAKIKYSDVISPTDWALWEKDKDTIFNANGRIFKVNRFTDDGDMVVEIKN